MESNAPITSNNQLIPANVIIKGKDDGKEKKKKPGVFGFFKAAMFAVRHRSKDKSAQQQVNNWKKLVGSMRPLNLHQSVAPSALPLTCDSPSTLSVCSGTMSQYASANDLQALDQPSGSMSQYASANDLQALDQPAASGSMSQYSSANDLQALDEEDEEEDPDQVFDAIGADDMIDTKAEEFIAQFYQQMRRQNIDSMSGHFD